MAHGQAQREEAREGQSWPIHRVRTLCQTLETKATPRVKERKRERENAKRTEQLDKSN